LATRSSPTHPIRETADRRRAAVQDVPVITVSEQFRNCENVVAVFEEMRRE
jgi:hypothetical protein